MAAHGSLSVHPQPGCKPVQPGHPSEPARGKVVGSVIFGDRSVGFGFWMADPAKPSVHTCCGAETFIRGAFGGGGTQEEAEHCVYEGLWKARGARGKGGVLDSRVSRGRGHLAEVKLLQAAAFSVCLVNQGNGLFTSRFWLPFNTPSLRGHRGRGLGGNKPRWWGGSAGVAHGCSLGLRG